MDQVQYEWHDPRLDSLQKKKHTFLALLEHYLVILGRGNLFKTASLIYFSIFLFLRNSNKEVVSPCKQTE